MRDCKEIVCVCVEKKEWGEGGTTHGRLIGHSLGFSCLRDCMGKWDERMGGFTGIL